MATTRIATASLLTTVTETAQALGSIVNTVNNTVSMANDFVKRHRDQQVIKNAVEQGDYVTALVEGKTREITLRREETKKWLDADASRQKIHDQVLNEVIAWLPEDKRPSFAA
jgi:hypothetical protein